MYMSNQRDIVRQRRERQMAPPSIASFGSSSPLAQNSPRRLTLISIKPINPIV